MEWSLSSTQALFFYMGLSRPHFGFILSFFLVHCWITIDKFYNSKWRPGNRKEYKEYAPFYNMLLEKAWRPQRIDWQPFWIEKSLSLSWDSNLACQDWMQLLYHLCQHHLCHHHLRHHHLCHHHFHKSLIVTLRFVFITLARLQALLVIKTCHISNRQSNIVSDLWKKMIKILHLAHDHENRNFVKRYKPAAGFEPTPWQHWSSSVRKL